MVSYTRKLELLYSFNEHFLRAHHAPALGWTHSSEHREACHSHLGIYLGLHHGP